MIKAFITSIPKNVLGPILVILGIVYFYFQDPPKSICDTQFVHFKQQTQKYLYGTEKNSIKIPAQYVYDFDACRESNSIGGCYDWSEGLKKTLKLSRSVPAECGPRLEELSPLMSYYASSLRLYSQISWNNTETVRARLFHWLDNEDLIIFCRLKNEYTRLAGKEGYSAVQMSLFNELSQLKKPMRKEEVWKRTVLSFDCNSL